ncbi:hypothetical protein [Amycolatopsis sp. NPDC058986]
MRTLLLDDGINREPGVFSDGTVVEADWQDALRLTDWGSFEG